MLEGIWIFKWLAVSSMLLSCCKFGILPGGSMWIKNLQHDFSVVNFVLTPPVKFKIYNIKLRTRTEQQ